MGDRLTQELIEGLAKEISESLPPVVNRQALHDRIEAMCEVNTEGPISREGSPYWRNSVVPEGFANQADGKAKNEADWIATKARAEARQLHFERAKEAAFIDRIAEAVVAKCSTTDALTAMLKHENELLKSMLADGKSKP